MNPNEQRVAEDNVNRNRARSMEQWVFESVCPSLAREKREFLLCLEERFRSHIESGREQNNNFQWAIVKKVFNRNKKTFKDIWSLKMFCEYVFKLFGMFHCDDDQLIMQIVYMHHEILKEYDTLGVCLNCCKVNNPRHYHYEEFEQATSIMKKINKREKSVYNFTNRELYSKLTISALIEGAYDSLKFLVKYGLSYFPVYELDEIKSRVTRMVAVHLHFTDPEKNARIAKDVLDESTEPILKQLLSGQENLNLKRLFLISIYVDICLDKRLKHNYYPDYIKCLNLFALTLPEAEISVKDVEDYLNVAFNHDEAFTTETCSDFKELFPKSPSISSPRPLKHLCRCFVRGSLRMHSSLQSLLSEIQIPKKLKEYLLILE